MWEMPLRLRQSMRIYLKNTPAKFHPDPIWKMEPLAFLKTSPQQQQQQQQQEKQQQDEQR